MAHDNENLPQPHVHAVPLNSIQRLWRITVPLGLCLSMAGAFAGWKLFVPNYSASAYLRIDSDNRPLIFKTADNSTGNGTDFRLYKNTQKQLMVTPFVLSAALHDTQMSSLKEISSQIDPIGWLQTNLKVSFLRDGEIMQVSAQTLSPTACVGIVNGVVDAFMQEVVQNARNDHLSRLNNLEQVYNEAETKIRQKQGELKSLSAAMGTSESDLEALAVRRQVLGNQEKILQEQVDKLATETRQRGRVSIDVELKRSEISGIEDVLNRVGEEIKRTSIELKTASRIKLLSLAVTSSPPDLSRRWTAAIALGMFGLVVPFGLFAMLDLVRKRVRNENL